MLQGMSLLQRPFICLGHTDEVFGGYKQCTEMARWSSLLLEGESHLQLTRKGQQDTEHR